jgi:alanyl-tRNA synthetase
LDDLPVRTRVTSYTEARKEGVKALFEEKYGDIVRVLDIPGFSTELCGGTHVSSTGQIGLVKITRDEGIGSGVRRITAVCGEAALSAFQNSVSLARELCDVLETDAASSVAKVKALLEEKKNLERHNQELALNAMAEDAKNCLKDAVRVGEFALIARSFEGASRDMLRRIGDRIKRQECDSILILAGVGDDGLSLVGMASDEAVRRGVHAGNLVKEISGMIGGSGGGKPAMGQGGGRDASRLRDALASAEDIVKRQIDRGAPAE